MYKKKLFDIVRDPKYIGTIYIFLMFRNEKIRKHCLNSSRVANMFTGLSRIYQESHLWR